VNLPGWVALRSYQRPWIRPDLIAGLTVGAMLIPQSMAYAELAGLAPQYGFYAVIGALVVYALVGTSRHLGVGPEPGTAILAATGVAAIAGGDGDRYVTLMAALALVVAAIAIVGALLRLGFVASALSKPVLVGYITGVGLTLLSSQIAPFTGIPIDADRFGPRIVELLGDLDQIDLPTFLVGLATLAVLVALRRWAPSWPGALLGVAGATAVVAAAGWAGEVAVVGAIPGGLPTPRVPAVSFDDLRSLLPVGLGIALVGYTDNVLTARSIASRQGYRIDPNQEMLALGLTNLTAGLSQGFPISSSASRTAVPASIGSRSQLVSVVAAAFVVVALVGARPLLEEIPRSALAAVIITAAIAIIDIDGYRALWRVSRLEAGLAVLAALGVVVFDVLVGVVIAVALSVLVALYRIARPHDAVLGDLPDLDGWVELDAYPEATPEPGLLVYRFDAPLFFVNASRFADRVEQAMADNPGDEEWVVLDFEGIGAIDATALDAVGELLDRLSELGVEVVAVTRANDEVCDRLRRAELVEPEGPLRLYATINGAVRAYRARREPGGSALTDRR
jgi:high affinity sulfate transporter 1